MPFGGLLLTRFGPKFVCVAGTLLLVGGVALSAWVTTLHGLIFTYGIMFGAGAGISYTAAYVSVQKYYPEKKGMVTGMVSMGYGSGALVFNQVATAFANPQNAEALVEYNGNRYFDGEVPNNVPTMFLILAISYALLMIIGCILIKEPPTSHLDEQLLAMHHDEDMHTSGSLNNSYNQDLYQYHEKEEHEDVSPRQLLYERQFYIIWIIYLFMSLGGVLVSTGYKAIGSSKIHDDSFLATIGSLASLCNGASRIFWGAIGDKFSFKIAVRFASCSVACILFTLWPVGSNLGEYGYLLWCCMTNFAYGGMYSLVPTAVYSFFGKTYAGANYGVVFSSQGITSLMVVFGSKELAHSMGYPGMLNICGVLALGACFASFFIQNPREKPTRDDPSRHSHWESNGNAHVVYNDEWKEEYSYSKRNKL